jgi:hypothetical protein
VPQLDGAERVVDDATIIGDAAMERIVRSADFLRRRPA